MYLDSAAWQRVPEKDRPEVQRRWAYAAKWRYYCKGIIRATAVEVCRPPSTVNSVAQCSTFNDRIVEVLYRRVCEEYPDPYVRE